MTTTLPPRTTLTDGDLVVRARGGDQQAFDRLYTRHVGAVTGVCGSRVPSGDVDDMVQDSFVKAWQKIDQLAEPDAFGAWVRAIAARRCIDLHRGSGRDTFATDEIDEAAAVTEGSDQFLLRREAADRVHRNLAALPERDREALFLRDGMNASITELAHRYDLSEGSTRVMLTRARHKLRASWAAVVAWLVGMRALRNLGQVSPQMVAVGAVAVAAPLLIGSLVAPSLAPSLVPGSAQESEIVVFTTPAVKAAVTATLQSPVTEEPARPATVGSIDTLGATTAAPDAAPTPTSTATSETVVAAPLAEDDVRVEKQQAEDNGQTVDEDVSAGNTGDNEADLSAGNIEDAFDDLTGMDGEEEDGRDEPTDEPSEDENRICVITCD